MNQKKAAINRMSESYVPSNPSELGSWLEAGAQSDESLPGDKIQVIIAEQDSLSERSDTTKLRIQSSSDAE